MTEKQEKRFRIVCPDGSESWTNELGMFEVKDQNGWIRIFDSDTSIDRQFVINGKVFAWENTSGDLFLCNFLDREKFGCQDASLSEEEVERFASLVMSNETKIICICPDGSEFWMKDWSWPFLGDETTSNGWFRVFHDDKCIDRQFFWCGKTFAFEDGGGNLVISGNSLEDFFSEEEDFFSEEEVERLAKLQSFQ